MKKLFILFAFVFTLVAQSASAQQKNADITIQMITELEPQFISKAQLKPNQIGMTMELVYDAISITKMVATDNTVSDSDKKRKIEQIKIDRDLQLKTLNITEAQIATIDQIVADMVKNLKKK